MIIKILGTGCPKCKLLEQAVRDAISELGIEAEILKVQDMGEILQYDLMSTPGLVIDEQVVLSGKVPSVAELKDIIKTKKTDLTETKSDDSCCFGCGCK